MDVEKINLLQYCRALDRIPETRTFHKGNQLHIIGDKNVPHQIQLFKEVAFTVLS